MLALSSQSRPKHPPQRFGVLRGVLVAATALMLGSASAYAQSYSGQEYSTGTTFSTAYAAYAAQSVDTSVAISSTQTSASGTRTLASNGWFSYNNTGVTDGTFENPGGGYPTGYEFTSSLAETGTGLDGAASVSIAGATNGTTAGNTWIKGATESGGDWNVLASQASFLGGYTNSSNTGTATLNLGAQYTSFSTLIGTNTGALLNVQIQAFNTASSTPGTAVYSYNMSGIKQSTADPYFTGFVGSATFNEIIITGLSTSTPAGNSTYTAYPDAAFITLAGVQVGRKNATSAVPEAGTVALFLPAGLIGMALVRRRRLHITK